jgi:tetratricopeptide (TPR) repeat protein
LKPGRLLEIWKQPILISEKETEVLESFTKDYPYFNLPYIILAKVYKDKQDFRYEDMMRQAALRSKDRKSFYEYLHQDDNPETTYQELEEEIAAAEPLISENTEPEDTEITTQHVEVEKDTLDNPDTTLIEKEDAAVEKLIDPETQPEESVAAPEFVEPESEESTVLTKSEGVPPVVEIEMLDVEKEEVSTADENVMTTEDSESMLSDNVAKPEEIEQPTALDEALDEPELKVERKEKAKPKSEAHTFDEWLNMFSQGSNESSLSSAKVTESPKDENKTKPVFKPKKKSNAPEAIALIEKFIEDKPSISKPKSTFFKAENAAKKSLEMDLSIATETLAKLFEKQGHPDKAIEIYQKLMLKFPKKERYFADLIEKLTLNNE